jgi:hypothetical protein
LFLADGILLEVVKHTMTKRRFVLLGYHRSVFTGDCVPYRIEERGLR